MRSQVYFVGPCRSMLLREIKVSVCNLDRQDQAVVFHTLALAQGLKFLGSEHPAKGIGRIDRTVNNNVGDVDTFL